jgi:hypothetical protein
MGGLLCHSQDLDQMSYTTITQTDQCDSQDLDHAAEVSDDEGGAIVHMPLNMNLQAHTQQTVTKQPVITACSYISRCQC